MTAMPVTEPEARGRIAQYRRWFDYERDSHAKVLASLHAAPEQVRASEAFRRAVDLCAHMVAARWLWLFRFGAVDRGPEELFPSAVPLEDLDPRFERMHEAWTSYLDRLEEAELRRVFEYRSYEGDRYRNVVEDILTQLFGHSWYHRGQVALLLRQCGAEPAPTDFVFWTREPVTPSSS